MYDRLSEVALPMQADSEIVMRKCAERLQLDDVLIMLNRLFHASLFQKQISERGFDIRIRLTNLGRRFVFNNPAVQAFLFQEKSAQPEMSDLILSGHSQRMPPKPFTIVPIPNLARRTQTERS